MSENRQPDFQGWATKYNIKCKDGRTIVPGAFAHCDGATVPMVYMHDHKSIDQVLGKAKLTHKPEGVWAECWVNDTEGGQTALKLVQHGDITSFSIFADELQESFNKAVSHGTIKELSLVLAGANTGAEIKNVIRHDDLTGEIYTADDAAIFKMENGDITISHADNNKPDDKPDGKTVDDVLSSFSPEQMTVVEGLVGAAIQAAQEETNKDMKHDGFDEGGDNMFSLLEGNDPANTNVMSHADVQAIFEDAPRYGSLKESVKQHGFQSPKYIAHSIDNIDILYPDATPVTAVPSWVKRPTGWVSKVLNGVKHVPFSKIKSMFADITGDEARAKGYIKGNKKEEEVFTLLRRVTEAQMIYKKQSMERDDWIDITPTFDIAIWLKSEMRMMLDEELARAFLIGDGRSSASKDKIDPLHIRPIAFDDDFYTLKTVVNVTATATETERAKGFVRAVTKTRKNYRGSGSPTLYITDDLLADMLLAEDGNGRPLYENEDKIKGVLRVSEIVTVPVMEGLKTADGKNTIEAIIVNLADYTSGADKGGSVTLFDDFDIDYNQMKYLIETKCSGALTVPASAMVFHFPAATVSG